MGKLKYHQAKESIIVSIIIMGSMLIYIAGVLFIAYLGWAVILIYSRNDDIVPFEFGPELYEAANEPKEFVEILGSHNNGFLASGEIYNKAWTKWLKFLKEYKGQSISHQAS